MLSQVKNDAVRMLGAIGSEQQSKTEDFRALCELCALLSQELECAIPSESEQENDEAYIDAIFKLDEAANLISSSLTSITSETNKQGEYSYESFLQSSKTLNEKAESLRGELKELAVQDLQLPSPLEIENRRMILNRDRELYRGLLEDMGNKKEIPGCEVPKILASWAESLKDWEEMVQKTLISWLIVLDQHLSELAIMESWHHRVTSVREHFESKREDSHGLHTSDFTQAEGSEYNTLSKSIGIPDVENENDKTSTSSENGHTSEEKNDSV
jgi:hypothetical protein